MTRSRLQAASTVLLLLSWSFLSSLPSPVDSEHIPSATVAEMNEWTTAIEVGDVETVRRLMRVPLDQLAEAQRREDVMREYLDPVDQNFKSWMKYGTRIDLGLMLDSLHSLPLVVYRLEPAMPLHNVHIWLEERMIGNRTPVTSDLRLLLEKADWLLKQKTHEIERLETHLYSLNRVKVSKKSHEADRDLGRLGIAFYSELGILPWKQDQPNGRLVDVLNQFLDQFALDNEALHSNHISPGLQPQQQQLQQQQQQVQDVKPILTPLVQGKPSSEAPPAAASGGVHQGHQGMQQQQEQEVTQQQQVDTDDAFMTLEGEDARFNFLLPPTPAAAQPERVLVVSSL